MGTWGGNTSTPPPLIFCNTLLKIGRQASIGREVCMYHDLLKRKLGISIPSHSHSMNRSAIFFDILNAGKIFKQPLSLTYSFIPHSLIHPSHTPSSLTYSFIPHILLHHSHTPSSLTYYFITHIHL